MSVTATTIMLSPRFDALYRVVTARLDEELPSHFSYHNTAHTKLVVDAAISIGKKEGCTDEEIEQLAVAALFHDSGFLQNHIDHEELSCRLAEEYLPGYDYTPEEIKAICTLITATRMPHRPQTKLESILCDADLSYLGTHNYFAIAEGLNRELKHLGVIKNWREWQVLQKEFLESHHYFTATARKEYGSTLQHNIYLLKQNKGNDSQSALRNKRLNTVQDFLLIGAGIITAGFGLKGFLVPNAFFDGGISGISLLIHELLHFNLAITIVVANLPFIALSYFTVSHRFAFRTFACVLLLGICIWYLRYPVITSDKLLVSIFGGFFLGLGAGLAMRAGCALDGVEVLALYTGRRTSFTVTEIILGINIIIFCIAAFRFGIETALYSILTYFTASKTIDYVVEGLEAYTGVTIISGNSELVKQRLVNELGRAITVYKGERGFLPGNFEVSSECDIIFTIITRLELRRLKNLVYETDPKAFVFANTVKEASGGILKRREAH